MKRILIALTLALLVSCSKDEIPCTGPGNITLTSRSIVGWENNVNVIIEIKGLDNPYHGFIEPLSTKEHRIEGHAEIRVRTACSEYSQWIEIGY
jgi:hypothetical protein